MVVLRGFRRILHYFGCPCLATSLAVPRALLVARLGPALKREGGTIMTSYSVMKASHDRAAVIATWPGFDSEEHSIKITTVASASYAHSLAFYLTQLSESAWDAAMWLDTYPEIAAAISKLIVQLRTSNKIGPQTVSTDGLRHGETWTSSALAEQLVDDYFISLLDDLTTTQRLSVADELETDADERRDLLDHTRDEYETDSRVNQAGLVTRVQEFGSIGPLPEGASGYLRTCYSEGLDFGDRLGAAKQIRRMEQLVAACNHHGGRARAHTDPCEAHCVVAVHPGKISDGDTPCYITPVRFGPHAHSPGRPNPYGKLRIRRGHEWIAEVDPDDTAGFVTALGDWAGTFAS